MSTVYFHSIAGTAMISGAERAYAQVMCNNLLQLSLGLSGSLIDGTEKYRKILPPDCYLLRTANDVEFARSFQTYTLTAGIWGEYLIMPTTGERLNPSTLALNTAVAIGSHPVRLLAKLHGQCECHCYVEGPNRSWLADIIELGVSDHILRTGKDFERSGLEPYGWLAVAKLLYSADDSPVVLSYSATEQFPNRHTAEWIPPEVDDTLIREKYELEEDEDMEGCKRDYINDLWYELPDEKQWEYALQGLRKANEKGKLEMKPETFALQGYGNGLSGFDLYAAMYS